MFALEAGLTPPGTINNPAPGTGRGVDGGSGEQELPLAGPSPGGFCAAGLIRKPPRSWQGVQKERLS